MTAKGLGPSPVCSMLARSGKVFLRMAIAAETLADGWESLSCIISASVSIASGVNFSHKARTSGSRFGRPPGLPLTPFLHGIIVLHCFQMKKRDKLPRSFRDDGLIFRALRARRASLRSPQLAPPVRIVRTVRKGENFLR